MPNQIGRPTGETDTRQLLLHQARLLFAAQGYQQVSTRQIAQACDVNAAMIRYYFGDKAGLFEAVLIETIAPLSQLLQQQLHNPQQLPPAIFIQLYYQLMGQAPDLPKLIFRSLQDPASAEHQIVSRVFGRFLQQTLANLQQMLQRPGVLWPGLNAQNAVLSCLSLSVFPFLLPELVKNLLQIELTPAFLTQLGQHQQVLLQQGLGPVGDDTHA